MSDLGAQPKVRLPPSPHVGVRLSWGDRVGIAKLPHRPQAERRLAKNRESRDQIGDQIGRMLDPDRYPDRRVRDS